MTKVMGDVGGIAAAGSGWYGDAVARLLALFRNSDRPLALGVIFWLDFVLVVVRYAAHVYPTTARTLPFQAWLFGLNIAVLLALWLALPWTASASRPRRLTPHWFLLATLTLGFVGSGGVHYPLMLTAFANVAFVYGIAVAAAATITILGILAALMLWFDPYNNFLTGVIELSAVGFGAVFAIGMAAATLEARRRREQSERLLARVRELAVAEERARMARDMHDSIGHHLTVIKMGLENADRFRRRRPEAAWDEVNQSKQQAAQALAETRRWVRALRPLDLEGRLGSEALEGLARSFDGTGVAVNFEMEGAEAALDADVELVLYRVLQEGLTNVLRHAQATTVRVRLAFRDARVTLAIGDDGQGTDAEQGFGLTSLRERAAALGGTLEARNAPGGGFELRVDLPQASPAVANGPAARQ